MKKTFALLLVLVVVALILPISNLFLASPEEPALSHYLAQDSSFEKTAGVLKRKCVNCHSSAVAFPFYAQLPLAKQIIQHDILEGREAYDFSKVFDVQAGEKISDADLAKLENAFEKKTMPPAPYLLMHWEAFVKSGDQKNVMEWVKDYRLKNDLRDSVALEFQGDALAPLPLSVKLDESKVVLGNKLYHDKRLSHDDTLSCASCHDLKKGGTDQAKTSTGIREQIGPINAPTTFNSSYQFKQFWDGRAADLEEQALGPIENPIEMGATLEEVLAKLNADPEIVAAFSAIYPDGVTAANLANAIAEFERSLITPNSRFDQYLRGKKDALTPVELEGYKLFRAHSCYTCHAGKALGGSSFEKMGREEDYFKTRGGEIKEADYGRFNATKDEADKYKFKVPTLRNIEVTYPYFHDASTEDLKEAVKIMAKHQTEEGVSDEEAEKIAAFLKTLTGEYQGKPLS